jgi:hypothetical protein
VATGAAALALARPANSAELMRGPHPFLKENQMDVSGGVASAAGAAIGGLRVQAGYGYQLVGSLWLGMHIGIVDGTDAPIDDAPCASCGRTFDVMAGLAYRLQTNLPIVPYGKLDGGFLFVFPDGYTSRAGVGVRPAVGARYFLFDWLGFGLELGGVVGLVGRDDVRGRGAGFGSLDATLGVEWQF